jgi:hypothetical protein
MKIFSRDLISNSKLLDEIKITLMTQGITEITQCFNKNLINQLIYETLNLFKTRKQRKDIIMQQTENTPRNMFSVGQSVIHNSSKLIPFFYCHSGLLEFLSNIVQEEVMLLPWESERYVINGLSGLGDVHGWHWDDYSYALVLIAKATDKESGGQLECIPFTSSASGTIDMVLSNNKPNIYSYSSGCVYLMKSNSTLHRVSPIIKKDALRVSLVMTFCNSSDCLKQIDHETIYNLYGV